MEEQQLLRDPNTELTREIIAEGLGAAYSAYVMFVEGLENHDIHVDWRYYTDGKAWLGKGLYKRVGVRGGQKEITTFWLSIWDGYFKITLYIPEKARADALALSLTADTKDMIKNAKQVGKLKFFPLIFDLRSDELFHEIYTLVHFMKAIK